MPFNKDLFFHKFPSHLFFLILSIWLLIKTLKLNSDKPNKFSNGWLLKYGRYRKQSDSCVPHKAKVNSYIWVCLCVYVYVWDKIGYFVSAYFIVDLFIWVVWLLYEMDSWRRYIFPSTLSSSWGPFSEGMYNKLIKTMTSQTHSYRE